MESAIIRMQVKSLFVQMVEEVTEAIIVFGNIAFKDSLTKRD